MPTYRRTSLLETDFETVWTFYDDVDELELLTPEWIGLRVTRAVGPDGRPDPDGYEVGTRVHLEMCPFGLFTTDEWVVEITDRHVDEDGATFVDEQVGDRGPYEEWRHVHRFVDLGDETVLSDEVNYRVPGAGDLPLATPFLAAILWYRHRQTRELLVN